MNWRKKLNSSLKVLFLALIMVFGLIPMKSSAAGKEIKIQGMHDAQVKYAKLYTYEDKETKKKDFLDGLDKTYDSTVYSNYYTVNLEEGDYWLEGYDANDDLNGGIKLTVTADTTSFYVQRVYAIYCSNTNWVEGTDYKTEVAVTNGSETREITLGQATYLNKTKTSCLFLKGDTISATFTPLGDKEETYIATTVSKTKQTMNAELSGKMSEIVNLTITVPKDSTVDVGKTLKNNYYTQEFYTGTKTSGENNTDVWSFKIAKEAADKVNGPYHFYRVKNEKGVTYWDFFNPGGLTDETKNITLTKEDLFIESSDFNNNTIIRDYSDNQHDTANIYMNINAQGYKSMKKGETYELNMFRNWQAIEHFYNRMIALPDMHYEIINLEGDNVISIKENEKNSSLATMTAQNQGTAIVLVTYDAMYSAQGMTDYGANEFYVGSKYSAIWPEFTGVFVVTVDKDGTSIDTGMKIDRQGKEGVLDAEHDILYYFDDNGASFSFKPATGAKVSINRGNLSAAALTFGKEFSTTGITTAGDGTVTITGLKTGRHIVKVEKDGVASYQVITARKASYELQDAEGNPLNEKSNIKANDTIYVQFSDLVNPCEKLAGIYNHEALIQYLGEDGTVFTAPKTGAYGVYDFSSNAEEQRLPVQIPKYWTGSTYTLKSGGITMKINGSSPTSHRSVSYVTGLEANYEAEQGISGVLCQMPDIEISLEETEFLERTISFENEKGSALQRKDLTVTLKDAENNVVSLKEDSSFQCVPGEYSYTVKAVGFLYKTGSFTVTAEAQNIKIVLNSSSENAWDGMTLTEPTQQEEIYQISNGAEFAWFANSVNNGNKSISAVLTADIDLALYEWLPMTGYAGSFDGQSHIISNLSITAKNGYNALFGSLAANAVVKNLTVKGDITTGSSATGGVVGSATTATIENCTSYVNISGTLNTVGGIVGNAAYSTISGCEYYGTLTTTGNNAAGIVGNLTSGTTKSKVSSCYNGGTITATTQVGGIVGYSTGIEITGSYNKGKISGNSYVGGIAGRVYATGYPASGGYAELKACYNAASVSGNSQVGGLFGNLNCTNVNDCYSSGTVSGTSSVGGAVGSQQSKVTVNHVYYLDTSVTSGNSLCEAKTSAELKTAELDSEYFGRTKEYPALLWQKDVKFVGDDYSYANVTVYLNITEDSKFVSKNNTVMGLKELTIPYFDIANYGLENLYYNSDCYNADTKEQTAGTKETAKDHITMLHAMIYVTEVYGYKVDEDEAGKGYLKTNVWDKDGAVESLFDVGGTAGSASISDFWGFGLNLNYYLNYEMPVAYKGWGSTCDQILLSDNDIISIRYNPFTGSDDGTFYHFGKTGDYKYDAEKDDKLVLTLYETSENWGTSETNHTAAGAGIKVYISSAVSADPAKGTYVGVTNSEGQVTIDTSKFKTGTYYITSASHDPAAAMLVITGEDDETVTGDANGDGVINSTDASLILMYVSGDLTDVDASVMDFNNDGKVNSTDASLILRSVAGLTD